MSASKWKPYPNYIESNIDSIPPYPSHWELKRVKYLIDETDGVKIGPFGSSLKLNTLTSDGIKIYGQGNVIKNDFNLGHRHLPVERFKSDFSQYEILDGDVLITMMGTTGKSKVFRKEFKRGIIDSHLIRLRFQKNQFNSDLFVITLQESEYMLHQLKLKSNGSIMEGLNSSIVKDLYVVKPPLSEQKQIERFLHRANEQISHTIENLESQQSLIEEKRLALITQAVTKGLTPDVAMKDSETQWIGEIPQHWNSKKLKFVSKIFRGKFGHRPRNDPKLYDGEYPFVQTGNVARADKYLTEYQQTLNELGRSVSEEFPSGTIVMAIAANIGDVAILTFDACFPDSIVGFKPKENMNREFIYYALKALASELDKVASQSTQQNLNIELVGNLTIPVPPLEEQIMISDFISELEKNSGRSIQKMQKKVMRLEEYRTALISAAVTGKIDLGEF